MEFEFKGKLIKMGLSHRVTIPADFVKHGMVRIGKEYIVVIKEVVK